MDIKTLLFILALGNLVFGLELILYQWRERYSQKNPFWIAAKLLQSLGWLFLAGRNTIPDYVYIPIGNAALFCGLAYECWAIFRLLGRPVSRDLHLAVTAGLLLLVALFSSLSSPVRIVIASLVMAFFLACPAWALGRARANRSRLRDTLGLVLWLMAGLMIARALWALLGPQQLDLFTANLVQVIVFLSLLLLMLINGFGMLLLSREATDRELHRVLGEQRAILETLPIGLCIRRQDRIERCNPVLETMFGFPPGTLVGRSARDLYASDQAHAEAVQRIQSVLESGRNFDGELVFRRHTGEPFWGRVQCTQLLPEQDRDYFLTTLSDISEQIHQQETLRQQRDALATARDQAEAANRAKSVFLANMSHEIRTPLNAILGFAQILARAPDMSAEQRQILRIIERAGGHLLTLIGDILDMAKIEAGRLLIRNAPFDLPALLGETESFFRQRAQEHGLTLTLSTGALPRMVEGDAIKLRQVLINLVGNAVKFTPAGGQVLLKAEALDAERLRFSVEDTGVGIAAEEQERIFEPFVQSEAGQRQQGGTGLGLALCRQLTQLLGGDIEVESRPGQGSRFTFSLRLPTVVALSAPTVPRDTSPILGFAPGQAVRRLLIVDDLADNRAPLHALLDSVNPSPPVLEIREAVNGHEALEIWESWQPHLIFMDIRMPVMSGEEATRRIRARMQERPEAVDTQVIALTASAFEEQREHFLEIGCAAFAHKPFQVDEILALIEQLGGLRAIRADDTGAPVEPLTRADLAERLAAQPESWRAALAEAVSIGDFEHIARLLEPLRETDTPLHETLAHWAHDYDLAAFMELCEGDAPSLNV